MLNFQECFNTTEYVGQYHCFRKYVLKFSQYMGIIKDLYPEYLKNYKWVIKTNNPRKKKDKGLQWIVHQGRYMNGPMSTWKDGLSHWLSGKCKLKLQRDNSYPQEWLKLRIMMANIGEDVEQLLYSVGGTIKY